MPANTTDSSQLKASSEDQNHDEMVPTNGDEQGYRPSDGPVSTASRCFYLDLTIVMFGTHIVNLALHKRAKRSGKQTQIGEAAALHPIIMVRPWFVHVSAFGLVREEKKRTYTSACQKLRNPFIG